MLRWLSGVLILCIAFAGVDAASDVESIGSCNDGLAHEVHSESQDSLLEPRGAPEDPTPPAGEHGSHFCHCAVHAPTLPSSAEPAVVPAPQPSPSVPIYLLGTSPTPPPVRPPKLV
jgi:hypothetical protein